MCPSPSLILAVAHVLSYVLLYVVCDGQSGVTQVSGGLEGAGTAERLGRQSRRPARPTGISEVHSLANLFFCIFVSMSLSICSSVCHSLYLLIVMCIQRTI